ncbi:MAG TPA: primosome assembly protein PriA, partial [Nocardioides bacterium]|nr:primosome assembly protein PriA [Nocardioides sp.]
VVSPEQVLSTAVARLAGALAERYAGTRSDVLRLAVPSRHATTEKKDSVAAVPPPAYDSAAAEAAWAAHGPAAAYLGHLATGGAPRAVWAAAPGTDWPLLVAHAVAATLAGGRGS